MRSTLPHYCFSFSLSHPPTDNWVLFHLEEGPLKFNKIRTTWSKEEREILPDASLSWDSCTMHVMQIFYEFLLSISSPRMMHSLILSNPSTAFGGGSWETQTTTTTTWTTTGFEQVLYCIGCRSMGRGNGGARSTSLESHYLSNEVEHRRQTFYGSSLSDGRALISARNTRFDDDTRIDGQSFTSSDRNTTNFEEYNKVERILVLN